MYLASSTTVFIGILAAIISAIVFGVGDFGSGELGKKLGPIVFFAGIYIVEIPMLFALMALTNTYGIFSMNVFLVLVGTLGTLGFFSMIFGLTKGYASIVMSLSGLLALVVPAIASIVIGEKTNTMVWFGVAVAIVAIVCVTKVSEPELDHEKLLHKNKIIISIFSGGFAGLAMGSYFVGLDQVESPIVPKLFFLQLSGFIFGVIYFAVKKKSFSKIKSSILWFILIGVGYQLGQMLFPFASDRTSLVVTNIIVNLYPAITIALVKYLNHEKTNQVQHIGFALAIGGVLLVSIGST